MDKLVLKAWLELTSLAMTMGFVLFASAGTVQFWQAWDFVALFFVWSSLMTIYLTRNDRELLKHRVSIGPLAERQPMQRIIMSVGSIEFLLVLVVSALDHRFAWSAQSIPVAVSGNVLIVTGFSIVFRVYQQNHFSSATVEIVEGQRVISKGLYALVRHPMYLGTLLILLGTPLSLASYWGLLALPPMIASLIWRLRGEERLLAKCLPGYPDYLRKVRFRLVPGIY
jgi:protein-S-isoprenylcysteine O-methyltransferase Ste14